MTRPKLNADVGSANFAKYHQTKATHHRDQANALTASQLAIGHRPSAIPLEAAGMVEAPTADIYKQGFMVMAGSIQTMTLGMGKPLTVTVNVNEAGARALNQQLQAVNASTKQRAFNCFNHKKEEASSWPTKIYWNADKQAVFECAEPSDSGLAAIQGKRYRGFSLTFYTNAEVTPRPAAEGGGYEIAEGAIGSPGNPAQIICPEDVTENPNLYLNMGTLTNRPASTHNEPLFASAPHPATDPGRNPISPPAPATAARKAGAQNPSSTTKTAVKPMIKNDQSDPAALQARNEQLETRITQLEAEDSAVSKAQLEAAQAELRENRAKMELAASQAKSRNLKPAKSPAKKRPPIRRSRI